MHGGVAASAEGVLQLGGHPGVGEVGVGGRVDQRRTGQAAQDFAHALADLEGVDAGGGHVDLVCQGMPAHGRFLIQFGRPHAGAGSLDVDGHLDELLDGLRTVLEAHDLSQGQAEAQGQFRLGQPPVAVVPEHPAHQRLFPVAVRRLAGENAISGYENVFHPDHGVQFVEPGAERRHEQVLVPGGGAARHHPQAGRVHRNDEPEVPAAARRHVVPGGDQQVLREGRAGVHLDLAAYDDAVGGFADQLERRAFALIRTEAGADQRAAAGVGDKPAGVGHIRQVLLRLGNVLGGVVQPLHHVLQAEGDELAVAGGVGHVPAGDEMHGADLPSESLQILGRLWRSHRDRTPLAVAVGRGQQDILPVGVEVAVVPGHVLIHHGRRGRVGGDVFHATLAQDPDVAPVAQALLVISPCPHVSPSLDGADPIGDFCPGSLQLLYVWVWLWFCLHELRFDPSLVERRPEV